MITAIKIWRNMSKYCPVNNFLTYILKCPQINVCAIDTGQSLTWCFVLLVEIIIYSDTWVWKEHSRHDGELVYISHIGYIWEINSFPSILRCFGHFLGTVTTLVSFSIWVNTFHISSFNMSSSSWKSASKSKSDNWWVSAILITFFWCWNRCSGCCLFFFEFLAFWWNLLRGHNSFVFSLLDISSHRNGC